MAMDNEFSSCDMLESICSGPRSVPLQYLRNITNDFSDERLVGEGGFGTVYKGVLPNGEIVAVKKLNSSMPGVKDRQFENEAYHLMRLKHPNVVLLVGWCSEIENIIVQHDGKYIYAEKSERLLCLEYMPKGNLRGYLSDESSGLTWETRYKIIEGICYGLHYLHEESQLNGPIVHMDLKPANILLDNNMVPKIADFGLSRLFSEEKTWTCTTSRDGTLGYMPPEYINRGLISTKSDIFSLGVIIIEIVTGKRDYPDESGMYSQEFTELVLKNWRHRLQKSLGYTSLEVDYQQIRRCILIGLNCVKLDRWKRPTISQIINTLHGTESADFSGKEVVCQQQHCSSTSEAPPHKHTSSLEKEKECQSSTRIKRSVDLARLEFELNPPAPLTLAGSAAARPLSVGLVHSFCIGGSGDGSGDLRLLCQRLGLSGPDDFAISVAEWEAHKAGRSRSSALTVREAAGGGRIKGDRPPPLLKPPPPMVLPLVGGAGSTWDILRSFAPGSSFARCFGQHDAVEKGEEAAVYEDIIRLRESSEGFTDTSSAATEFMFYISPNPNGRLRRKIRSWNRGMLLGSGSFGMVYEGISDEGVFFAVKEVSLLDDGINAKESVFQLEQEIALLSQFEHENIVQYYGTDKDDSKLYVFLELMTQGSLASLYQKYRLQDTHASAYTRQILNGLTYLHERNIVHRDIKCANIMVHANGSVKLADFGLAKEIINSLSDCKGSVNWMAPEVVHPKKTYYGPAADIWSLGCTVLEMLTRQIPYPDLEWTNAFLRIGRGEAPTIPSALSKDARDFISQCVKPNPEDRPSASELLEHPFLNMSIRAI